MKNLLIFALSLTLWACDRSYEFNRVVEPRIIVNSMLTPDSVIRVDLWRSKRMDSSPEFRRVEGAKVVISQDNQPILETISQDRQLVYQHHPKAGSTYSITIDEPTLQYTVTAQTTVPEPPSGNCTYLGRENSNDHFTFDNTYMDTKNTSALLITGWSELDTSVLNSYGIEKWEDAGGQPFKSFSYRSYKEFYTDSQYADLVNCINPTSMILRFDSYIRFNATLVDRAFPCDFSCPKPAMWILFPRDWWYYPELYPAERHEGFNIPYRHYFQLVAASKDYDLYHSSLTTFRKHTEIQGTIQDALFSAPSYRIHSNVNNGLGIFAAFSSSTIFSFNPTE